MNEHLLIKIATRSRPERCFAVLESILNNLADKENYTIVVSADMDDLITYNQPVINRFKLYLKNYNVRLFFDESKNKIHAINRDIEKIGQWNLLLVAGDFVEFFKGFDNELRLVNSMNAEKNICCYHFFDGFQREKISVPVINRGWYNTYRSVYHPSYQSNFADVDLKEMAIAAKQYFNALDYPRPLFIRKHPENLFYAPDIQMMNNQQSWRKDLINFERRQRECFVS